MFPAFRALFLPSAVVVALLGAVAVPAQADERLPVRLIYDDSRNPTPYATVLYCCQWNPDTGEFAEDWMGFQRRPMRDDGTGGDEKAGDHVWTAVDRLKPSPGRVMWWGGDTDHDQGNGWLGSCGSILVERGQVIESLARSMPDEAYATVDEFAGYHGFDPGVAAAPRLLAESGKVLFTFRTSDAARVFLAGDFNEFAHNRDGRITDPQALMYKGRNDVWYRALRVDQPEFRFKYVLEYPDGVVRWVGDPSVKEQDKDGNSLVRRSELLDAVPSPTPVAVGALQPVRWREWDPTLLDQVRAREGKVLLYVRMKSNKRCRDFEKAWLLDEASRRRFAGRTLLFVDASDWESREFLRELRIQSVPALASSIGTGPWETLLWTDATPPATVTAFLDRAAGAP